MQANNQTSSYEQYKLIQNVVVIDISVERLVELNPEFKRFVRPLKEVDISTTNYKPEL